MADEEKRMIKKSMFNRLYINLLFLFVLLYFMIQYGEQYEPYMPNFPIPLAGFLGAIIGNTIVALLQLIKL